MLIGLITYNEWPVYFIKGAVKGNEMQEIGSEFHKMPLDNGIGVEILSSGSLVFSGRTAIETVLKELPNARKALIPSYCCDSMIVPFRKAGIDVEFYPVNFEGKLNMELDITERTDVLLWCNYFGFNTPMPDLSAFRGAIIEDITHSLLSDVPYNPQSQYLIASIRKWGPINCGGYCATTNGELFSKPILEPPEEFTKKRALAMELKAEYLLDYDEGKKTKYLHLFEECNQWVAKNYSELSIDTISREYLTTVDEERQKEQRRKNAAVLYNRLKEKIRFVFPESDMDCPIFVPIFLNDRDNVRQALIDKQIYCPVHWPKPYGCESNLYEHELSLICDQRYTESDMEYLADKILGVIDE